MTVESNTASFARPKRTVLVVGAGGHLGRRVVEAFWEHGYRVRALSRAAGRSARRPYVDETVQGDLLRPETLDAACAGAHVVFSCAGASLDPRALRDRRTYAEVDERGHVALFEAAARAGVGHVAYVSLFGGERMERVEYARAHEAAVRALRRSGLAHTIVRPTGFFWMFGEVFRAARSGLALVVGSGEARTNPVHELDLAEASVAAVERGLPELAIGGPETLTRLEIARRAFAALGRPPRVVHVRPGVLRATAALARPLQPRLAALIEFGTAASVTDVVAPAHGVRRLDAYFAELAAAAAPVALARVREA